MYAIRLGLRRDGVLDQLPGRWVVDYDPVVDPATGTYGLTLTRDCAAALRFPTPAAALYYANRGAPLSPLRANYDVRIEEV